MKWTLVLPDWAHLDTIRRSSLPFALWQVGPQPLLHHWLDEAVDQGVKEVHIQCSDRPGEVRKVMESAHLWPIHWTLEAVPQTEPTEKAAFVDRLPGQEPYDGPPTDGWALLDRWFELRRGWFDRAPHHVPHFERLALGRFTQIHPTAEIRMPVWFEDFVQVGPHSIVGPYVSLGEGAVLDGPSQVENAVITNQTILAGYTELKDAILDGGRLIHLRHRAQIPKLDILISDSLRRRNAEPSAAERATAALLYGLSEVAARMRGSATPAKLRSFDGLELEEESQGPLWIRRRRWLKEVARGKMRLWGVLPRTEEQLTALPEEWRQILSLAPRGVFSYSDLHGAHQADTDLEPIHAVFQATASREAMREVFKENFWRLVTVDPD
ncbi:MAG: hypothetical protein ACFB9M_19030 [Myxococcota bacterium]